MFGRRDHSLDNCSAPLQTGWWSHISSPVSLCGGKKENNKRFTEMERKSIFSWIFTDQSVTQSPLVVAHPWQLTIRTNFSYPLFIIIQSNPSDCVPAVDMCVCICLQCKCDFVQISEVLAASQIRQHLFSPSVGSRWPVELNCNAKEMEFTYDEMRSCKWKKYRTGKAIKIIIKVPANNTFKVQSS